MELAGTSPGSHEQCIAAFQLLSCAGGFWRAGSEPLGGSITEHKLKGMNSFNAASIMDTAMRSGSETAVDAMSRRSSVAPASPGRCEVQHVHGF